MWSILPPRPAGPPLARSCVKRRHMCPRRNATNTSSGIHRFQLEGPTLRTAHVTAFSCRRFHRALLMKRRRLAGVIGAAPLDHSATLASHWYVCVHESTLITSLSKAPTHNVGAIPTVDEWEAPPARCPPATTSPSRDGGEPSCVTTLTPAHTRTLT
jgi:hypothetical protein